MVQVLYIAGLSYSGSTILDLLLSSHPDVVGLGEVISAVHKKDYSGEQTKGQCSCDASMEDCSFWATIPRVPNVTTSQAYHAIVDQAQAQGKKVVIDSSKKVSGLAHWLPLQAEGKITLSVIHISKDVRGYLHSSQKRRKKRKKVPFPSGYFLHKWVTHTNTIEQAIATNNLPHRTVLYDDLCNHTDTVLTKIWQFVGLPAQSTADLAQLNFHSHIAYGNHTKAKFMASPEVRLDTAWKDKRSYSWWLAVSPAAKAANSRIREQSKADFDIA